ncbi:MAG: hypothetical protein HY043_03180 [Verrucomicrobia bacterium]|nr:hypothetical protein [Verrucomicrobiota bacterium]
MKTIPRTAGQSVFWKYKTIHRQGDDRVGQRANIVNLPLDNQHQTQIKERNKS